LVFRTAAVRGIERLGVGLGQTSRGGAALQALRRAKEPQTVPAFQAARRRKRCTASLRRPWIDDLVIGIACWLFIDRLQIALIDSIEMLHSPPQITSARFVWMHWWVRSPSRSVEISPYSECRASELDISMVRASWGTTSSPCCCSSSAR